MPTALKAKRTTSPTRPRTQRPPTYSTAAKPLLPILEHTVPLRDGRLLGVAEFGIPDGKPILWFHGTPGARRQVPPNARAYAAKEGLRIIGVERPGVGLSTPHLYQSVMGWAEDIAQLADCLRLDRFGLIGLSGGGPYVLACAYGLPQRVVAAAVFGGVAPTHGVDAPAGGLVRIASYLEPLFTLSARPLGTFLSSLIRSLHPISDPVFDLFLRVAPPGDRAVLARPDMRAMFTDDLLQGSKSGLRSIVYDVILFARPWGFSLRDIRIPVHFWQGDSDAFVPLSHGAQQAALVPGARLTLRPGEGHLGGLDAAAEAIAFILSHWTTRRTAPR